MSKLKAMLGHGVGLAAVGVMAVVLAACGAVTSSSAAASPPPSSFKLQSEYVKLVQDVGPSVVLIETNVGLGSGIIYESRVTSSPTTTSSRARRLS
jgi:hypothetical protein